MLGRTLLVLALTGTACAMPVATQPDTYHADVTFTPADREAILEGGIFLAYHTNKSFSVVFDLDHTAPLGSHTIHNGRDPEQPSYAVAYYNGPLDSVCLDMTGIHSVEWRYPDFAKATAAHELGHSLGLSHHDGPGLMNPANTNLAWTPEDQTGCMSDEVCK